MNKKLMLSLIFLFLIFTIVIGLAYSFYVPEWNGNQNVSTTMFSNRNIEVDYPIGTNLLIDSTHTSVTKNITMKNNSASSINYLVYFYDVNNTLVDQTKLTHSYTCTGSGCDTGSNIQVPEMDGRASVLVTLGSGVTHTYEITLTYNGTPTETFSGRIAVMKPIIYGLSINNNIYGTRTDDAVGKTAVKRADKLNIDSDFDTAEIYKEMVEVTDSYGNQFVYIPRFYIKKTKTGPVVWTYQISKTKVDDNYYLSESFINPSTGDILDYVLVGRYEARINGTNLESKRGANPAVSQTISTFRTYAKNNGSSYQIMDIHVLDVINTLVYIELGTIEPQKFIFGYSNFGSSFKVCGSTDVVLTASGNASAGIDGTNSMRYRYMENLYGQIWKFVDGINVRNNLVYVSSNSANYVSDVFSGDYQPIGYTNALTNNYAKELGYDSNYPYANFPIVVDTVTNTLYADRYQQVTGDMIPLYGGDMSTSFGASGINCWNINVASSTSTDRIGARLVKKAF